MYLNRHQSIIRVFDVVRSSGDADNDNGFVINERQKKSFRYQSLQDEKSIQDILKAVSSGIARGKISFSDGDEKIVMRPKGLLDLKLTAQQEGNRNRFNIRISWQTEDDTVSKKKRLSVK